MRWKKYLPIIGIGIFLYILFKINILSVFEEVAQTNWFFLFLGIIFVFPLLIVQTMKWYFIALKQGINIGFLEAFKINLISNFYGFVTPSKIGVIIRAEYLKKYTKNIGKGIGNFVIDKILDTASVLFIAIVFSFIFGKLLSVPKVYLIGVFIFIIVFGFVFSKKERAEFLLRGFYKKLVPKKIKKKARLTFDSFYEGIPGKRWIVLFFLLNIISWIIIYFVAFLIGLSLGINLNFIYFLAILPIGTIVGLLPITINGLGTREAVLISLFGFFGIGATKVFSMSMVNLFVTGVLPGIIACFFIFGFGKSR